MNLSHVVDSKFRKIKEESKHFDEIEKYKEKISSFINGVSRIFLTFEDEIEGRGLHQALTTEDKDDIKRNSENIKNIDIYRYLLKKSGLLGGVNNNSEESSGGNNDSEKSSVIDIEK